MAEFDQSPQSGPQYPYFWAMPTREPKPDESGLIRGQGMAKAMDIGGRAIGEGLAALNTAEETGIRNDVYSQGDKFMNKEVASLYSQYQGITGNVPPEIQGLPQTVGNLNDARANGKISQTDHDARLDSLAKELRAKYPGYRQEVDEHLRAATGRGSTANQLWESLRGDIDSATAARRAKASKVETELWSAANSGVPGATQWMSLYQAGKMTDLDVMGKLQQAYSYKYTDAKMGMEIKALELQGAQGKVLKQKASDGITYRVNHIVSNYMDNMLFHVGAHDPATLRQLTEMAGKGQLSSEEAIQLEGMLNSVRAKIYGEAWSQIHQADNQGKSDATYAGGDEDVKKLIDAGLSNWDTFSHVIAHDNDYSAASAVKLLIEGSQEDAARGLQQKPDTAALIRRMGAIAKLGPEVAPAVISAIMQDGQLQKAIQRELLSTGADLVLPPGEMGYRETFEQHLTKLQQMNAPPEAYQHLINMAGNIIGNPKAPLETREAVVQAVFGLDNTGVISKFGTKVNKYGDTDQSTVFNNLLAGKNIKEIHKMSEHVPALWARTKAWAENSWQTLARSDLEELNTAVRDFSGPDMGVDFGYNFETHEIEARPYGGTGHFKNQMPPGLEQTLQRINKNLHVMSNMYETEGTDPTLGITRLLQSAGVDNQIIQSILMSIKTGLSSQ